MTSFIPKANRTSALVKLLLLVLVIASAVAVLVVNALSMNTMPSVAEGLADTRRAASFLDLQIQSTFGEPLLIQLWFLKAIGIDYLVSSQLAGSICVLAGLTWGAWLLSRRLGGGVVATAALFALFVLADQPRWWSHYGLVAYPLAMVMGFPLTHVLVGLSRCSVKLDLIVALAASLVLAGACFVSPVYAIPIATLLAIITLQGTIRTKSVAARFRLWVAVTLLGMPAMLVAVGQVWLYPHSAAGSYPDYASMLVLGTEGSDSNVVWFFFSRTWWLLQEAIAFGTPGPLGLTPIWPIWTVFWIFAGLVGGSGLFAFQYAHLRRLILLWLGANLVVFGVLGATRLFPYGWIRYEYFVLGPILLLCSLGLSDIVMVAMRSTRHFVRRIGQTAAPAISIALLSMLVVVTWNTWEKTSRTNERLRSAFETIRHNSEVSKIVDSHVMHQLRLHDLDFSPILHEIPRDTVAMKRPIAASIAETQAATTDIGRLMTITSFPFSDSRYHDHHEAVLASGLHSSMRRDAPGFHVELWTPSVSQGHIQFDGGAKFGPPKKNGWRQLRLPPGAKVLIWERCDLATGTTLKSSIEVRGDTTSIVLCVERHGSGTPEGSCRPLDERVVTHRLQYGQIAVRSMIRNDGDSNRLIEIRDWLVVAKPSDGQDTSFQAFK